MQWKIVDAEKAEKAGMRIVEAEKLGSVLRLDISKVPEDSRSWEEYAKDNGVICMEQE